LIVFDLLSKKQQQRNQFDNKTEVLNSRLNVVDLVMLISKMQLVPDVPTAFKSDKLRILI
jgi:hypothetical protein